MHKSILPESINTFGSFTWSNMLPRDYQRLTKEIISGGFPVCQHPHPQLLRPSLSCITPHLTSTLHSRRSVIKQGIVPQEHKTLLFSLAVELAFKHSSIRHGNSTLGSHSQLAAPTSSAPWHGILAVLLSKYGLLQVCSSHHTANSTNEEAVNYKQRRIAVWLLKFASPET